MRQRVVASVALIVSLVFWRIWLPGIKAANDFPYVFLGGADKRMHLPQVWSSFGNGMGEYTAATLWSWPIDILYRVGFNLGIDFSYLLLIFGIVPFILFGSCGINLLISRLGVKSVWGRMLASILYLLNSYIILVIDGGQIAVALAYAFFPVAYVLVTDSVEKGFQERLIAGIAVSVLGFFDIRFVYVLGILLGLRLVWRLRYFRKWLSSAVVIIFIFIGLNAYWLLPLFSSSPGSVTTSFISNSDPANFSFASLGHSLLLLHPNWFKNVFGAVGPLRAEFVFIPILVFLSPVISRKKSEVGFWLMVALISVFLAKGTGGPFGEVYIWLVKVVPGFSLFRDPTKFYFLLTLSFSALLALGFGSRTGTKNKFVTIALIVYLLSLASPVYISRMTGLFSKQPYESQFVKIAELLLKDESFSRVLYIPSRAPLGYVSNTHQSVDISRLSGLRPFAAGTVGTYEFFNFLREGEHVGELFKVSGIGYIVNPLPDPRRQMLKPDEELYFDTFSGQIERRGFTDKKISDFPVNAYKLQRPQDRLFLASNSFAIVGSDRLYQELIGLDNFDLSENSLIFVEEGRGDASTAYDKVDKVILFDKGEFDLAVSMIPPNELVFPAKYLNKDPVENGWWKRDTSDFVNWRAFLQNKYGLDSLDFDYQGGWAIGEDGSRPLTIKNKLFNAGDILLARVMTSSRGGSLEFYQAEREIGEVDTIEEKPERVDVKLTGDRFGSDQVFTYDKARFDWHEIGTLKSDGDVDIKVSGDINVVNALVSVDRNTFEKAKDEASQVMGGGRVVVWGGLDKVAKRGLFANNKDKTASLEFEEYSPTHFGVVVSGIEKHTTLVFNDSFDNRWKINGQASTPVYGLFNSFKIEKDGEYVLFFEPQKYVVPGFIVSAMTLLSVGGYILYNFVSERKKKDS